MTDGDARSYSMGDVGAGAQVAQGSDISQVQRVGGAVDAEAIRAAFVPVLAAIDNDPTLDEDDRSIARDAVGEVVDATVNAPQDPSALKRALTKAKKLLGGAWDGVVAAMSSDAVQKTLGTITEAATRAGIAAVLGR